MSNDPEILVFSFQFILCSKRNRYSTHPILTFLPNISLFTRLNKNSFGWPSLPHRKKRCYIHLCRLFCYLPPMYIPMGHGLQPSASVSKRHPSGSGTASLLEEEDPRTPGPGSGTGGHWACPCGKAREAAFRRVSMTSKSVSFQAGAAGAARSSCCCAKKKSSFKRTRRTPRNPP